MCGIVGHIGLKNSVNIVLEGLKRLEYRGYDSAGICFKTASNDFHLIKKEGELNNLLSAIKDINKESNICIGHTRWATHGEVNDTNAHPHLMENVSVVHNGIIENSEDLKSVLSKEGYKFQSQTDSEVFVALIAKNLNSGLDFFSSVSKAFEKITGNSAFVVINKDTDEMIAVKRGAPLVCGLNKKTREVMVSSDAYALVGKAKELYFPEDEVVCVLNNQKSSMIEFKEFNNSESKRYLYREQLMTESLSEKGEFEHYMLKEIYEQPSLIRSFVDYYFSEAGESDLNKVSGLNLSKVHITACGTAYYAGLIIKDFLERENKIPTTADLASEFRYREPLLHKDDLGLFISQSGETADTLAAQQLCQKENLKTMAIVNSEGSSLYRGCDYNLLIKAGVEIGVASTKAFTLQVLTGHIFSKKISNSLNEVKEKYELLASRIEEVLNNVDLIKNIAESVHDKNGYFFTGRGKYYPVALEGALKLKEIAYVHSEGYAAGELKHGPIALIDEKMVNIAIVGPELYEKTVSNIQEIKARHGIIISIGPKGDKSLENLSDYYIPLNFEGLNELSPLYVNVVSQLFSYYMAKFKGTDIDKPRNLAKSVTVE